jgi:hypothetical protein
MQQQMEQDEGPIDQQVGLDEVQKKLRGLGQKQGGKRKGNTNEA